MLNLGFFTKKIFDSHGGFLGESASSGPSARFLGRETFDVSNLLEAWKNTWWYVTEYQIQKPKNAHDNLVGGFNPFETY